MCRLYSVCVCGIDRVWIYRNDVYHNAHNTIVYSRSSLLHTCSNISMHRLCSEACSCEACIAKAVLLPSTVATAILVSAHFESGCLNNRSVPPLVSFWIPIWNFSLNFLSCSRPDARHLEWCARHQLRKPDLHETNNLRQFSLLGSVFNKKILISCNKPHGKLTGYRFEINLDEQRKIY